MLYNRALRSHLYRQQKRLPLTQDSRKSFGALLIPVRELA